MSATATVRRTVRNLADGREIIYYDDTPGAPARTTDDDRPLPERAAAGHLRYDALVGDWVAVAGHRMNRVLLPSSRGVPAVPDRPRQHRDRDPRLRLRRRGHREPLPLLRPRRGGRRPW